MFIPWLGLLIAFGLYLHALHYAQWAGNEITRLQERLERYEGNDGKGDWEDDDEDEWEDDRDEQD